MAWCRHAWANVDPDPSHHMASLGHSELISLIYSFNAILALRYFNALLGTHTLFSSWSWGEHVASQASQLELDFQVNLSKLPFDFPKKFVKTNKAMLIFFMRRDIDLNMLCTAQLPGPVLKAFGRVQFSPLQLADKSPMIPWSQTSTQQGAH